MRLKDVSDAETETAQAGVHAEKKALTGLNTEAKPITGPVSAKPNTGPVSAKPITGPVSAKPITGPVSAKPIPGY